MYKAIMSAAGASLIAAFTLMPTIASADHRYHRDWDRGPNFGIYIGPQYPHHRDFDDRYAYDYGRYSRHHHDHDWDRD